MCLFSLMRLHQICILELSLHSNEREKMAWTGNSKGEECEPLAPFAVQSERLPMWRALAVNSPLRWAWSRGNASQSPACVPTWEQLQPPSASSSWWLPEGNTLHPSISEERQHSFDRGGFQGLMTSVGHFPWLLVNMCASLSLWNTHGHKKAHTHT